MRERDILSDVLKNPKRHAEAILCLGISGVCVGAAFVLSLIR
jgi:hypothetical protein